MQNTEKKEPALLSPFAPAPDSPYGHVFICPCMETFFTIMAIPVKLPVFEGPLDLLMHLIEKNKIDIYDIPIVEITDQYLAYVRQMDHEDMDVTSEFLVMAATLLDIKSRMLLPREKDEETGEEEADPREELVRRLLEYKMFKYMSEELAVCREQAGVRYFRAQDLPREVRSYQPPIDYEDLLRGTDLKKLEKVFGEVLRRKKSRRDPIRSGFGKIKREEVNIDTKTLYIRAYLQSHPRTDFRALLESQESKEEVIVTFLILLELMKVQKVHIVQDSICGKILIEASEASGTADSPADSPANSAVDSASGSAADSALNSAADSALDSAAETEALSAPGSETPEEFPSSAESEKSGQVCEAAETEEVTAVSESEVPEETLEDPESSEKPELMSLSLQRRAERISPPVSVCTVTPFPVTEAESVPESFFGQVPGTEPAAAVEDETSEFEEKITEPVVETAVPVEEVPEPAEEAAPIAEELPEPAEEAAPIAEELPEPAEEAAPIAEKLPEPAEEASVPCFAERLWCKGKGLPRHMPSRFSFRSGAARGFRTAKDSPARRVVRSNPLWERTRLSRLWARRR